MRLQNVVQQILENSLQQSDGAFNFKENIWQPIVIFKMKIVLFQNNQNLI